MYQDYVVEFKLPCDPSLFVRHATNVSARNEREAISLVRPHIPDGYSWSASKGVIMLYGVPWATVDPSLGADYQPAECPLEMRIRLWKSASPSAARSFR